MPDATPFPLNEASGPLICLSHLRWDFVLQRPQHLMGRFARSRDVLVWEEAVGTTYEKPFYEVHPVPGTRVHAIRPAIPDGTSPEDSERMQKALFDDFLKTMLKGQKPVLWFYTPMMWPLAEGVEAEAIVYDCMDELSQFKLAPPELRSREQELLQAADVVFTGGYSIWEVKKLSHDNIHPFPSSVDARHFAQARGGMDAPADMVAIPGPRLGFYGVIDERIDLALLDHLAASRPDWQIVMVGPVVKIDEADLPRRPNIHYLGGKSYHELPAYLAGWDVAMMPFAINEATRFISPTKTPEYLAAGRPVVSTPIRDVVRHYGTLQGVRIADTAEAFVQACDEAMALSKTPEAWLPEVDKMLSELSWDTTFKRMDRLVAEAAQMRRTRRAPDRFAAPGIRRGGSKPYDVVIAGAGFAGSVMAERLAEASGKRILVVDKRPHIAGNAYDHHDKGGILIHQYGPHIFHTNSDQVVDYLSRFTAWRPYEHRVLASVQGKLLPMPINRTTLNGLYNLNLQTDEDAAAFLAAQAEPVEKIETSRDVVVNAVGTHLYETFFQCYTRKQWGLDPSQLDKSVTSRVPTRTSLDDRYFTDSFQAMPKDGFTRMFERMLDHPNIDLALGADYHDLKPSELAPLTIYTGPIDHFFGYRFGPLPYRSLQFRHETLPQRRLQEVAVVNYPAEDIPYTRITEYKHLTGQVAPNTSITYEYPSGEGDPYYPIPRPENQVLYKKYEALALQREDVIFLGRLGTYRYYNMDQVVGQALATHRRLHERLQAQATASSTAAE
jgi:UDP-galactopyranose mutase